VAIIAGLWISLPAGLLLAERDTILVTGALVAAEIYGRWMPIVELSDSDFSRLATGRAVALTAGLAPSPVQVRVDSWTDTPERIRS
ncbi:MAG: hypothetical protein L0H26_02840, partial [Microlunatus sp.]|nr:hypothetical protein [Microlunatus sp.]